MDKNQSLETNDFNTQPNTQPPQLQTTVEDTTNQFQPPINPEADPQNPKKSNKNLKKYGIIAAAAIGIIILGAIITVIFSKGFGNRIAGKWSCKPQSYSQSSSSSTYDYIMNLELNDDGTFLYGTNDNYLTGTYSYERENKTYENYEFYMVTMNASKNYSDGTSQDVTPPTSASMELAMDGEDRATIFFTNSYHMYSCYR